MCTATLNDAGRVVCRNDQPHEPHRGCLFWLLDGDPKRDHEEDTR